MDESLFFFFNDTATTEIYTLSLHDALPICVIGTGVKPRWIEIWAHSATNAAPAHTSRTSVSRPPRGTTARRRVAARSEEHTSELQSRQYLVCRLLLEKKKNTVTSSHDVSYT